MGIHWEVAAAERWRQRGNVEHRNVIGYDDMPWSCTSLFPGRNKGVWSFNRTLPKVLFFVSNFETNLLI